MGQDESSPDTEKEKTSNYTEETPKRTITEEEINKTKRKRVSSESSPIAETPHIKKKANEEEETGEEETGKERKKDMTTIYDILRTATRLNMAQAAEIGGFCKRQADESEKWKKEAAMLAEKVTRQDEEIKKLNEIIQRKEGLINDQRMKTGGQDIAKEIGEILETRLKVLEGKWEAKIAGIRSQNLGVKSKKIKRSKTSTSLTRDTEETEMEGVEEVGSKTSKTVQYPRLPVDGKTAGTKEETKEAKEDKTKEWTIVGKDGKPAKPTINRTREQTISENKSAKKGGIRALQALIPAQENKKATGRTWARITAAGVNKTTEGLIKEYDPATDGVEIRTMKNQEARGLLGQVSSAQDLEKLQGSKALLEKGYQVETLGNKRPRIIIYDVPKEITKEEMRRDLEERNNHIGGATEGDFKLLFAIKAANGQGQHWVAETTPSIRKITMQERRIKMKWMVRKVDDYLDAARCFNCLRYGHGAVNCGQKAATCGYCGEAGHKHKECVKRINKTGGPVCTPCKIAKLDYDHDTRYKGCPMLMKAIKDRIRNTSYAA